MVTDGWPGVGRGDLVLRVHPDGAVGEVDLGERVEGDRVGHVGRGRAGGPAGADARDDRPVDVGLDVVRRDVDGEGAAGLAIACTRSNAGLLAFELVPLDSKSTPPAARTVAPGSIVAFEVWLTTPIDRETCMLFGLVVPAVMFWLTRAVPVAVELAVDPIATLPPVEAIRALGLTSVIGVGRAVHERDGGAEASCCWSRWPALGVGRAGGLDVDQAAAHDLRVLADRDRRARGPVVDRDRQVDQVQDRQVVDQREGAVEQPGDPLPPRPELVVAVLPLVRDQVATIGTSPEVASMSTPPPSMTAAFADEVAASSVMAEERAAAVIVGKLRPSSV